MAGNVLAGDFDIRLNGSKAASTIWKNDIWLISALLVKASVPSLILKTKYKCKGQNSENIPAFECNKLIPILR